MNKKIYTIISIIAFLAFLAIAAFFSLKNYSANNVQIHDEGQKIEKKDSDYQIGKLAIKNLDYNECFKISAKENIDGCITAVAIQLGDEKICEKIENSDIKKECAENIRYSKVINAGNIDGCSGLENRLQEDCYVHFFRNYADKEYCDGPVYMKEKCFDILKLRDAAESKDIKKCGDLSSDDEAKRCEELIKKMPKDQDGDGLDDHFERELGTDPFKKDTDGDGIGDFDEVYR